MKLASGTSLAQLLLIAAAPILTRLYSPEDFGALEAFAAVSGILIIVSAGRYDLAVVLPKEDDEAIRVAGVGLALSVVTAVLTLLGCALTLALTEGAGVAGWGWWTLLLAPTVLMGGWSTVFVAYAIRTGGFGTVAAMSVLRYTVAVVTQIGLGMLKVSPGGLLLGNFLSVSAANLRLGRPVIRGLQRQRGLRESMAASARRYSRFPKHTLPASLLNSGSLLGTPLLVGAIFGAATLGIWSLAQRVLVIPSTFVGGAIAESYYRRAVQLRGSGRPALQLFDRTVVSLAMISLIPFILIGISAEVVFTVVFGEEWAEAGTYVRIMLPWLWLRFISSPVSRTALAQERNRLDLGINGWLLVVLLALSSGAHVLGLEFTEFLLALSLANACSYAAFLIIWRQLVSKAA